MKTSIAFACAILSLANINAQEINTDDRYSQIEMVQKKHLPTEDNVIENQDVLHIKTFVKTPMIAETFYRSLVKTIVDIDLDGQWIRLEDGSVWNVSYFLGRREVRKQWNVGDKVAMSYDYYGFFAEVAIHNLTHSLSVYGILKYPPQLYQKESVVITGVSKNCIETNQGTMLFFEQAPPSWTEYAVGDSLILLLPTGGKTDGSVVHVWNFRLSSLGVSCRQAGCK